MSTADQLSEYLQDLHPTYVALENESMQHAGYFEGKESHFKLTIVSEAFAGKRPVTRHQQIYALAGPLLTSAGGTIHALAIHAYTPGEWANTDAAPDSPLCAGNNK